MQKILNLLFSLANPKSKHYREANKLREASRSLHGTLAPIDAGELKLLSYQHVPQKRFALKKPNILTTIYNEPSIAYYVKNINGEKNKVIVAFTSDNEFTYIVYNANIDVFVNEQPYARIKPDGTIKDLSNRTVGYFEKSGSAFTKLFIHQNEIATIRKPTNMGITDRIFSEIDVKGKAEEDLILTVSLVEIISKITHFLDKK